jgi:tRNA-dihydrouridine synthase
LQDSLLDGIMIGQAAIGNPWIFTSHVPDKHELKQTVLKHLDLMIACEYYFQEQIQDFAGVLKMPSAQDLSVYAKVDQPKAVILAEFRKHLFSYVK